VSIALLLPVAAASLRRRWSGFLGSFVALALGVALLASVGMMVNSAGSSDTDAQGPSLYKLLIFATGATAFISIFVVANTFAFAVAQRRKETALLRALGATPSQVRLLVLGEALLVALVAAAVGCLAGLALAPAFADWLVSLGAAPQGFGAKPALAPLLVAAAAGFVVALLGAASASQQAVSVRPVEALQDAAVDRRVMSPVRWLVIVHHLAGSALMVLVYVSAPSFLLRDPGMRGPEIKLTWAMIFSLMAITAVILFAPILVPPLVRLLMLPTHLVASASGLLARQNALTAARRTISTAIPTFVVVATAGCVAGGVLAFGTAWTTQEHTTLNATYVAEPASGPQFSTRALAGLRALPGVAATSVTPLQLNNPVADYASGDPRIDVAAGPVTADAVDGDPRTVWNLQVEAGSLNGFGTGTAVVSNDLARSHGWRVGDRISGSLPDGAAVTLRLVAFFRPPLPAFPEVLLPAASTVGHLSGSVSSATAYLTTPPGISASQLTAAGGGITVIPAGTWVASQLATQDRYDRITMIAIAGPGLLYALLAIVNTMIMSTQDRRRDFTTLRLAGSAPRQVLRMVALESTLVVAVATLLGLAVTAVFQAGTTELINRDVLIGGTTIALRLPWAELGLGAGLCLVLAVVSSVVPARYALSTRSA